MTNQREPPRGLGALVRPFDSREQKYSLARTVAPRAVDLSQPRLLSRWNGSEDVRSPVGDQGAMGSCAAWAAVKAAEMARRIAGLGEPVWLAAGPLYEQARRLRGWFPDDTGSFIADNLDLLLDGGPAVVEPYIDRAAHDYDEAAWIGKEARDYAASHRPFYPSEGSFAENVWTALDAGMPIVFGVFWPGAWNSPTRGEVSPLTSVPANAGGHAFECWGIVPGYYLCANQWSAGWSADAAAFGHDCRAGDFAIPWTSEPLIFEARAVSFEPVPELEPIENLAEHMRTAAHRSCDSLIDAVQRNPSDPENWARLAGGEHVRDAVEAAWLQGV